MLRRIPFPVKWCICDSGRERSGLYRKPHRICADRPLKSHGFSIRVLGYNKRVISVARYAIFTCIRAWENHR